MPNFLLCLALVALVVATNSAAFTRSSGDKPVIKDISLRAAPTRPKNWETDVKVPKAIVEDGGSFKYGYEYRVEVSGWVKLELFPATWKEAYLKCYSEGAVLLSPETVLKWRMMQALINGVSNRVGPVHTGIHATFGKRSYHSIEGTPLNQMPVLWAPSGPNIRGESLAMLPNGTLTSIEFSEAYPYICFKDKYKNEKRNECGTPDEDYTFEIETGSCYKVHTSPSDWDGAFSACNHEGAHLVIIESYAEALAMSRRLKEAQSRMDGDFRKNAAYIGILSVGRGHWLTIHGQSLREAGYEGWANGEPNIVHYTPAATAACGTVYTDDGNLDDTYCETQLAFICEMEPLSLTRFVQSACRA